MYSYFLDRELQLSDLSLIFLHIQFLFFCFFFWCWCVYELEQNICVPILKFTFSPRFVFVHTIYFPFAKAPSLHSLLSNTNQIISAKYQRAFFSAYIYLKVIILTIAYFCLPTRSIEIVQQKRFLAFVFRQQCHITMYTCALLSIKLTKAVQNAGVESLRS